MMFASGKEALLFYIKARLAGFSPRNSEAKMMEDEGFNLQYDANILPGSPYYTIIIETLVDLEKIFKRSLSPLENQALFAWATNSMEELEGDNLTPPTAKKNFNDLSEEGKRFRIQQMLIKLEGGLDAHKYLNKAQRDATRWKRVDWVI